MDYIQMKKEVIYHDINACNPKSVSVFLLFISPQEKGQLGVYYIVV